MQGPFTATVDIGSPFKVTSTPYMIAGQPAKPAAVVRRIVWPVLVVVPILVLVLLVVAGVVVVLVVRKGQAQ